MSKIFERYGYRLDRWSDEAAKNRAKAWRPFMDAECDGGGNRHLSSINRKNSSYLRRYLPGMDIVQSGVCSIRLREGEQPWIVCPRRLLSLKAQAQSDCRSHVRAELAKRSELEPGKTCRVWSEVKMKIETTNDDDEAKSFDYTFDY